VADACLIASFAATINDTKNPPGKRPMHAAMSNKRLSRRSVLQNLGVSATLGLLSGGLPRRARAAAEPVAETTYGKLRGASNNGVYSFKGVRYGAPTGGANRFLPPAAPTSWAGIQDAVTFGASAPQVPATLGPFSAWYTAIQPISEDCLFLNVFTPGLDHARRPVMVWLHGGGWVNCAGTAPGFDGTNLARGGNVVVVTINHRLNVFGQIALGTTDPRFADAANAGVLDMVAALRWVRDNIASFGGDPGNVTIFGQSGGAAKVTALMGLPAAHGLFHKAIAESCSGGLRLTGPEEADRQAHALAAQLGMTSVTGEALQSVPMERLLAAMQTVADPFRPVLDGRNYQHNPFDPAASATVSAVPLMIGNAATEATLFLSGDPHNFSLDADAVKHRIARFLQIDAARTDRLIDAYQATLDKPTPSDVLIAVATDYMYRRNTTRIAALQAAQSPVYAYVFNWKTPVAGGVLRSPHTIEVPFVFGTTAAAVGLVGGGKDIPVLTRATLGRWSAFAHTGAPNVAGLPTWPRYTADSRSTMMLDLDSHVVSNPGGEARMAMDGLPYYEYSMPANFMRA
jgi:para-nitrobenzyl esterase